MEVLALILDDPILLWVERRRQWMYRSAVLPLRVRIRLLGLVRRWENPRPELFRTAGRLSEIRYRAARYGSLEILGEAPLASIGVSSLEDAIGASWATQIPSLKLMDIHEEIQIDDRLSRTATYLAIRRISGRVEVDRVSENQGRRVKNWYDKVRTSRSIHSIIWAKISNDLEWERSSLSFW